MPSLRTFFSRQSILLLLWAAVLFACCLGLYTRHHRFPYYYHPDEPGKVDQILDGKWNFHHPMLLLSTVKLATRLAGTPRRDQAVAEVGREVSAAFMALAVVALSLTAYLWRGWIPALIAGGALASDHQLYELAHYLKEDSALLAGLSLAFLAALFYAQAPSLRRAALLGAGCGLAISGKYLGVVSLGIALPLLWADPRAVRIHRLGAFVGALVLVFSLIDLPLVADFFSAPGSGTVHQSLSSEMHQVVSGQGAFTRRIPHALYWNVFLDNTTPIVWLLLLAFFLRRRGRRSTERRIERLVAAFPVVFALVLSFSPKENDRYFLPATALFMLLASVGVLHAPNLAARLLGFFGARRPERLLTGHVRLAMMWSLGVLLWLMQLTGWTSGKPGLLRYDQAFREDDIAELATWMRANVPPDAVVVADHRAGLQDPSRKRQIDPANQVPQQLNVSKLAADEGTLDELRSQGVGYVVVSETSYGKFFREDLRAQDERDPAYLKAKAFYAHLLREGELLFQRDRGTVIYLHPGIRVYRL